MLHIRSIEHPLVMVDKIHDTIRALHWDIGFGPLISDDIVLPVSVRSVGYGIVQSGHRESRMRQNVLMIVWSLSGEGGVERHGSASDLPAGSWVWLYPGRAYSLYAVSAEWDFRWISFDGPGLPGWCEAWAHDSAVRLTQSPLDTNQHGDLLRSVRGQGVRHQQRCFNQAVH